MFGLAIVCRSHPEGNFNQVPAFQIPRFEVRVVLSQFLPITLFSGIPLGDAGHGFSGEDAMKKEFRFLYFGRWRRYIFYRVFGGTAKHNEAGGQCKEEFECSIHFPFGRQTD